jgi:DNA-binding transcriptional LysR family regulator
MARPPSTDAPKRDFDLLKSLEIFVAVAETGSMTAAAGRLRITQSAISQQIKLLETDFGAQLFHRDMRPLRLTAAGQTLRKRAGALLIEAGQMRSEVLQAADGKLPHLRIAILSTLAKYFVPIILQAVRNKSLAVENVSITRGMTVNHAHDLMNRDADVALTSDAFDDSPGFQHLELLRESYLLATPLGFARDVSDLGALAADLPFLRFSGRTQSGPRIEGHLRRLRLNVAHSASFEAASDLLGSVASGHGWSIISPSQLLGALEAGVKIESHPLPKPGLSRTIGLVWRDGEMAETIKQLVRLCQETLSDDVMPRMRSALKDAELYFQILNPPAK